MRPGYMSRLAEPAWGKLCGDRDPNTGLACLLADDHYQERQTKHRAVDAVTVGRRVTRTTIRWGPGRDTTGDLHPDGLDGAAWPDRPLYQPGDLVDVAGSGTWKHGGRTFIGRMSTGHPVIQVGGDARLYFTECVRPHVDGCE